MILYVFWWKIPERRLERRQEALFSTICYVFWRLLKLAHWNLGCKLQNQRVKIHRTVEKKLLYFFYWTLAFRRRRADVVLDDQHFHIQVKGSHRFIPSLIPITTRRIEPSLKVPILLQGIEWSQERDSFFLQSFEPRNINDI